MRNALLGIALCFLPASTCFGALQLVTSGGVLQGYGLGTQTTILNVQNSNTSQLSGCVGGTAASRVYGNSLTSGACVAATPNNIQNQSQTWSFTDLGVTSIADFFNLGVVYNTNQQQNGPITLYSIVLTVYNAAGTTALWTTTGQLQDFNGNNQASLIITPTGGGVGRADAVFVIEENATAPTLAAALGSFNGSYRLGAYLLTGCSGPQTTTCLQNDDGGENISVARLTPVSDTTVPEPGTWALLCASLAVLALRKFSARTA